MTGARSSDPSLRSAGGRTIAITLPTNSAPPSASSRVLDQVLAEEHDAIMPDRSRVANRTSRFWLLRLVADEVAAAMAALPVLLRPGCR